MEAAGVEMSLICGDVTTLPESGVGSGFRLVLDTGTFHDFNRTQRLAMGRGIDELASDDATVLLMVWPRRRRPMIRGVDREDIEEAFSGWTITDVEPSHLRLPKPLELILRPDEHWYRLRRTWYGSASFGGVA